MSEAEQDGPDEEIEVGETGSTLRFWLAKEAIRHGEAHMTAQAASIAAMEARATSILGWAVTGVFALGAVSATGTFRAAAGFAAFALFLSAGVCVAGLWPRKWFGVGLMPTQIIDTQYESEIEVQEYVALGYDEAIKQNERRLESFGRCLSWSWVLFAASPLIAAITAYFASLKA